jgi:hypothetical protein
MTCSEIEPEFSWLIRYSQVAVAAAFVVAVMNIRFDAMMLWCFYDSQTGETQ